MDKVDLLLINPPFHTRNGSGALFPLGLGYIISSVINHGYSWRVIDCTKTIYSFYPEDLKEFSETLSAELQAYNPVMIGIGPCITTQLKALKIITHCCKKIFPSTPIVAGGPLVSINGQEWLFFEELGLDYIIKGDGEEAIPGALAAIKQTGTIANCPQVSRVDYNYVNIIDNIDSIPFPYRELNKDDKFSIRRTSTEKLLSQCAMITSRGCPYACNYCVSGNLFQKVRKRSANSIIDEMEHLHNEYGIEDIVFYDDCFFNNIKTISTDINYFCNLLLNKGLKVTWQIELRPDFVLALDGQSIDLLNKSGCRQINIGIEKVSASGLQFLGKNSNLNGLREKLLEIKNRSDIKLSATFILGGGAETREDILELIAESTQLGLHFAHYNPLFLYPGTPLYKQVFDNDRAWADVICNDSLPWGEIVYESATLKCTDLLELVDIAYAEFYKGTKLANQEMITDRFNIKRGGNEIENI